MEKIKKLLIAVKNGLRNRVVIAAIATSIGTGLGLNVEHPVFKIFVDSIFPTVVAAPLVPVDARTSTYQQTYVYPGTCLMVCGARSLVGVSGSSVSS